VGKDHEFVFLVGWYFDLVVRAAKCACLVDGGALRVGATSVGLGCGQCDER